MWVCKDLSFTDSSVRPVWISRICPPYIEGEGTPKPFPQTPRIRSVNGTVSAAVSASLCVLSIRLVPLSIWQLNTVQWSRAATPCLSPVSCLLESVSLFPVQAVLIVLSAGERLSVTRGLYADILGSEASAKAGVEYDSSCVYVFLKPNKCEGIGWWLQSQFSQRWSRK